MRRRLAEKSLNDLHDMAYLVEAALSDGEIHACRARSAQRHCIYDTTYPRLSSLLCVRCRPKGERPSASRRAGVCENSNYWQHKSLSWMCAARTERLRSGTFIHSLESGVPLASLRSNRYSLGERAQLNHISKSRVAKSARTKK